MTPSSFSPQRKLGLSIKEMAAEYRPQTRLMTEGSTALSDAELLSIIIRTGSRMENALNLCHRMQDKTLLERLYWKLQQRKYGTMGKGICWIQKLD